MNRSMLGIALLSSLTLYSCQEKKAPPPSEANVPNLAADAPDVVEAIGPFAGFSASVDDLAAMESFPILWPPVQNWAGIDAPEHEVFIGVLPVEGNSGDKGFFALAIPQSAVTDSLEASFLALHRKRVSVLYYPAKDAPRAGEDSEIDLLDEVENLETKFGNVILPTSLAPFFRLQRQGNSLFELCFPIAVEAEYQGYRVLSSRLGQRCRTWTLGGTRASEIDANDQRVTRWTDTALQNPADNEPEFLLGNDGRLWRRTQITLPMLDGAQPSEVVLIEWPKAEGDIEDLPWTALVATKELRSWAESEGNDSPKDALAAIARLIALRTHASNLSPQSETWFELEAKVLEKAAKFLAQAKGLESAWGFMSNAIAQLDRAAGGTLPRPSATMLFVDEAHEIQELGWRGTGHTLDLGRFPTWVENDGKWALDLPTRRNGVLRCDEKRCARTERDREAKSLYHPTQATVVTNIDSFGDNPSLVVTSTYAPHHCEALQHCDANAGCTPLRLAGVNSPARRAGKVFASIALRGLTGAQRDSEVCGVPDSSDHNQIRPLAWSSETEFVFLVGPDARSVNLTSGTIRELPLSELSPQQWSVAGYSKDGIRYELRFSGNDAAVWRITSSGDEMMPFVGIRAPQSPASVHSWVLPTPDDSLVAVIWHGVFVGVWPTSRAAQD